MRNILFLSILIVLTSWNVPDPPCQKKTNIKSDSFKIRIYPDCNDSTHYLIRSYERDTLIREEWVKNNKLNGLEKTYYWKNGQCSLPETYWENNKALFSFTYYASTSFYKEFEKYLNDSLSFVTRYYSNGSIKEFGTNKYGLSVGFWVEDDSLTCNTWKGIYRIKTNVEIAEEETVILKTITLESERDSTWIHTAPDNTILEKIHYVNGQPKATH